MPPILHLIYVGCFFNSKKKCIWVAGGFRAYLIVEGNTEQNDFLTFGLAV